MRLIVVASFALTAFWYSTSRAATTFASSAADAPLDSATIPSVSASAAFFQFLMMPPQENFAYRSNRLANKLGKSCGRRAALLKAPQSGAQYAAENKQSCL